MRIRVILVLMTLCSVGARAAEVVDATGRSVQLSDQVLLAALSNAVIYGHALLPAELAAVPAGASPVQP